MSRRYFRTDCNNCKKVVEENRVLDKLVSTEFNTDHAVRVTRLSMCFEQD